MGNHFTGVEYEVSVSASDPDGDVLSYKLNVNGGTIDDDTKESIMWFLPIIFPFIIPKFIPNI